MIEFDRGTAIRRSLAGWSRTVTVACALLVSLTPGAAHRGHASAQSTDPVATLEASLAVKAARTAQAARAPTRPFAMGFSTFPHRLSGEAVVEAMDRIREDADLALVHEDGGVPWEEALTRAPFPTAWRELLDFYEAAIEPSHRTVVAVTPLNATRSGMALNRGEAPQQPLPPRWEGLSLGHPRVIRAYLRYCRRMIDLFEPDWFVFSIEANMLRSQSPEKWRAYVKLVRRVYRGLKRSHPDIPLAQSLQVEFFLREQEDQARALRRIIPFTDLIALSTYAFGNVSDDANPKALPGDYFEPLRELAPDKPWAIAETAWPAEDVGNPVPTTIPANPRWQKRYVRWLMGQARRGDAEFVAWFFSRDYDAAWEESFRDLPEAQRLRIWRDTGLWDGEGRPRRALRVWRRWLRRERPEPPPP